MSVMGSVSHCRVSGPDISATVSPRLLTCGACAKNWVNVLGELSSKLAQSYDLGLKINTLSFFQLSFVENQLQCASIERNPVFYPFMLSFFFLISHRCYHLFLFSLSFVSVRCLRRNVKM